MLELYSRRVAAFVTFEDHVKMGGFGTAVIEALDEMGIAVPVVRIGWPDQFIEHGKIDDLRAKYGLTVDAAEARCCRLFARPPAHVGRELEVREFRNLNRLLYPAKSEPPSSAIAGAQSTAQLSRASSDPDQSA